MASDLNLNLRARRAACMAMFSPDRSFAPLGRGNAELERHLARLTLTDGAPAKKRAIQERPQA